LRDLRPLLDELNAGSRAPIAGAAAGASTGPEAIRRSAAVLWPLRALLRTASLRSQAARAGISRHRLAALDGSALKR